MIVNDMGITVHEEAPDADALMMMETSNTDEDAAEEAAARACSVDAELGRTTDPVRMYMREMGTVELLTREGEIEIAKRIEEGLETSWRPCRSSRVRSSTSLTRTTLLLPTTS